MILKGHSLDLNTQSYLEDLIFNTFPQRKINNIIPYVALPLPPGENIVVLFGYFNRFNNDEGSSEQMDILYLKDGLPCELKNANYPVYTLVDKYDNLTGFLSFTGFKIILENMIDILPNDAPPIVPITTLNPISMLYYKKGDNNQMVISLLASNNSPVGSLFKFYKDGNLITTSPIPTEKGFDNFSHLTSLVNSTLSINEKDLSASEIEAFRVELGDNDLLPFTKRNTVISSDGFTISFFLFYAAFRFEGGNSSYMSYCDGAKVVIKKVDGLTTIIHSEILQRQNFEERIIYNKKIYNTDCTIEQCRVFITPKFQGLEAMEFELKIN